MAHSAETAELIHRLYAPDLSVEQLKAEGEAMRGLIQPDFVQLGHVNPARWRHIAQVYARLGMLPEHSDLTGFIYSEIRDAADTRRSELVRGS